MKRILITGVSGFIGNSLKEFIEESVPFFEVYGVDISLSKPTERYFKRDLNDRRALRDIVKRVSPHYIFHLAGLTNKEDPHKLLSANIFSTYNLLDSLLDLKNIKTRIIVPGSAAEYGRVSQKNMPVKETCSLKPINFYGYIKMYQTLLALSFCKKGLDVVVGRIFNIIGWGSPKKLVIGNFACQIALIEKGRKRGKIESKDLNSKRDFLDIQDVCSALVAIAKKGKRGEIYNICSGKSQKIREMLDGLMKISNCRKHTTKFSPKSSSEVKGIRGSNKKIRKDTGWIPKVKITESLNSTLNYYREKDGK